MDAILSRLPDHQWFERNKGKVTGLLAGTLGTTILTLFLVVAITGNPYGRELPPPEPVYIIE